MVKFTFLSEDGYTMRFFEDVCASLVVASGAANTEVLFGRGLSPSGFSVGVRSLSLQSGEMQLTTIDGTDLSFETRSVHVFEERTVVNGYNDEWLSISPRDSASTPRAALSVLTSMADEPWIDEENARAEVASVVGLDNRDEQIDLTIGILLGLALDGLISMTDIRPETDINSELSGVELLLDVARVWRKLPRRRIANIAMEITDLGRERLAADAASIT